MIEKMNMAAARRSEILGVSKRESFGGIVRFEGLGLRELETLVSEGFADPEDCQNHAPSLGEILAFMRRFPDFTAHGYAVDPERNDYRVSIEGVHLGRIASDEEFSSFMELFRHADEVTCRNTVAGLYCWYD